MKNKLRLGFRTKDLNKRRKKNRPPSRFPLGGLGRDRRKDGLLLLAVVADCLDRTSFEGFHADRDILLGGRLLVDE
jgi:hypothetical protein